MKAILTKEDVAKAIASLVAMGKKPTLTAIHAALANRGSMSTLIKLKAEIEAEAVKRRDSEEGLRAFRELWDLAVNEGRTQKEAEREDLRQSLNALLAEAQAMEGEVAAANARVEDFQKRHTSMTTEVTKATELLTAARASGEQQALKLAEALGRIEILQTSHATEIARLREQLDQAHAKAHDLDLKLARAEARLDMSGQAVVPAPVVAQPLRKKR